MSGVGGAKRGRFRIGRDTGATGGSRRLEIMRSLTAHHLPTTVFSSWNSLVPTKEWNPLHTRDLEAYS